ncbi:hypothetical protein H0H92_000465 [Tricholoma furcatifolium]|nr:hypothetical protein H0H92_000465 [Tricholoma furcatifolium]
MQKTGKQAKAAELGAKKSQGTGGMSNVLARVSAKSATFGSGSTNPAQLERERLMESPEVMGIGKTVALSTDQDTSFETNIGDFTLRPASWSEEMDIRDDHEHAERRLMRAKASRRARSHSAGPPDVRQRREPEETAEAISEARKAVKESMENVQRIEREMEAKFGIMMNNILNKIDEKMNAPKAPEKPTNKGKGPDPRNWGDVELSDGELSAGEQEVRLNLFSEKEANKEAYIDPGESSGNRSVRIKEENLPMKDELEQTELTSRRKVKQQIRLLKQLSKDLKRRETKGYSRRERTSREPMSAEMDELIQETSSKGNSAKENNRGNKKRSGVRPSDMMGKDTYIGEVLNKIHRKKRVEESAESTDDMTSDSSSEGDGEDPSSPSDDSPSDTEESESPKKSKGSHGKGRYSAIKPHPPEKYDGNPDPTKFIQLQGT